MEKSQSPQQEPNPNNETPDAVPNIEENNPSTNENHIRNEEELQGDEPNGHDGLML